MPATMAAQGHQRPSLPLGLIVPQEKPSSQMRRSLMHELRLLYLRHRFISHLEWTPCKA